MKGSFAVVTDSTADLPDEWRVRYGIEVVPLKVLFGNESFRDRVDMTDQEFFRRLSSGACGWLAEGVAVWPQCA